MCVVMHTCIDLSAYVFVCLCVCVCVFKRVTEEQSVELRHRAKEVSS